MVKGVVMVMVNLNGCGCHRGCSEGTHLLAASVHFKGTYECLPRATPRPITILVQCTDWPKPRAASCVCLCLFVCACPHVCACVRVCVCACVLVERTVRTGRSHAYGLH